MVKEVQYLCMSYNVVITDVRLLREAAVIKNELDGFIIKIERQAGLREGHDHNTEIEAELATYPYIDYVISNSGDLIDLQIMQEMVHDDIRR